MTRWFTSQGLPFVAAGALALALSGSSSAQQPANSDPSQWSADQRAKFDADFARSVHDSCYTSAQQHGAPSDAAEKYCSCVVSKLAPLPAEEKLALKEHQDTLTAASNACKAQ